MAKADKTTPAAPTAPNAEEIRLAAKMVAAHSGCGKKDAAKRLDRMKPDTIRQLAAQARDQEKNTAKRSTKSP